MKISKFAASLLLAGATGAAVLSGCNGKPAAPNGPAAMPPLPVSTITVSTADVPLTGEWVGTMDGYVNANIQPQVSGYLIKQDYREGAPVAKGEVLFEIDPRPFQAALDQAEGQLNQAKATLGLSEINVKRDTPLAAAHAIAQSQLDNDTQQRAQGQAVVASAEAAVEAAKLNLGFTKVRSLISGIAGQATVQVGNLVNPQSVLTSVSQLNPIKVYFSISDSEYLALTQRAQAGGNSLLNSHNLPLTMTLSNGEVYPAQGHIVFVDRQLNAQTGAIRIAAAFPNPKNELRPGEFARVKAETEVLHNVVLVPQSAVSELQGMEQVDTVGPENRVHVVNVQLGPQVGQNWIVKSGLTHGATVITDNLQKLREGAPVNPHPAEPANGPTAASAPSAGR